MKNNDVVSFLLRSPLHLLMGNTMLITVTGRRTGRKITLPVSYYVDGDTLWVISMRRRTWWRNLLPGARVLLHVDGRDVEGIADVVVDEAAVAAQIGKYLNHVPFSARSLGLRRQNGLVTPRTPNASQRTACS